MIVKSSELPKVEKDINTTVCWMDSKKLIPGAKYFVQHNTNEFWLKLTASKQLQLIFQEQQKRPN
jgi:sulfate adenylyltransferase subunit 1